MGRDLDAVITGLCGAECVLDEVNEESGESSITSSSSTKVISSTSTGIPESTGGNTGGLSEDTFRVSIGSGEETEVIDELGDGVSFSCGRVTGGAELVAEVSLFGATRLSQSDAMRNVDMEACLCYAVYLRYGFKNVALASSLQCV